MSDVTDDGEGNGTTTDDVRCSHCGHQRNRGTEPTRREESNDVRPAANARAVAGSTWENISARSGGQIFPYFF